MQVSTAFGLFQTEVNADPPAVTEGRRRRDLFVDGLDPLDDVIRVIPSGSLARGTQLDPIHDVDLIVEFAPAEHSDWGTPGQSADDALTYLAGQVMRRLGATNGIVGREVRLTSKRNHVVKCFLDDPESKNPFAVEVAPALRQDDGSLLLPERHNSRWITANPEYLIAEVRRRQSGWADFVPVARELKWWKKSFGLDMKNLVMEVLALRCLPDGDRPTSLARFFTAAAADVMTGVHDPAGHCGEIQPDLDRAKARDALLATAELANRALDAAAADDLDGAVCMWRQVFGPAFPEPPSGCAGLGGKASRSSATALFGAGASGMAAATAPRRRIRDVPQG
jgi:Second Messenger Oligonucleotide or Dinucleotide Synthetase domain